MNSYLRVVFPKPGFFILDVPVTLTVNGVVAFTGSFMQGFDWWAPLPPGFHTVQTSIGGLRNKTFTFGVQEATTTIATLEYSRFWGNFKETPARLDFVRSS
ncbi:MAG: hypothetical protein KIT84_08305 [Labilithrix sp.]|nr:hypothetical protein [Labilithrix sp.]MCW5810999.1 hypothetical protein [Labilithrix sp.]